MIKTNVMLFTPATPFSVEEVLPRNYQGSRVNVVLHLPKLDKVDASPRNRLTSKLGLYVP
jgi:hypothetical protein